MKLSQLKTIVKEAVKEAIQEEMKDILMEAVRSPKQTVYENRMGTPTTNVAAPSPMNPVMQSSLPETDKATLRENMMNVLDGTLFLLRISQQLLLIACLLKIAAFQTMVF